MVKINLKHSKLPKNNRLMDSITVGAFIKFSLLFGIVLGTLTACNNEPILLPNDVNLTPFSDIPLPQYIESLAEVMDTSILDNHHRFDHTNSLRQEGEWMEEWRYTGYKKPNGHAGTAQVTVILYSSVTDAEDFFPAGCAVRKLYRSEAEAGIDGSSQLYISYLEEQRAGPEGLYEPLGIYSSCIAFQRSNLLIQISEDTDSSDRSQINEVIKELAAAFYVISD